MSDFELLSLIMMILNIIVMIFCIYKSNKKVTAHSLQN